MDKIDAFAVAIDETEYYNISEADAPFIERILSVYLFDRNQQTNLCEMASSYFLTHLYDQVILVDDVDDCRREEIDDKYACQPVDDIYVHCITIDRLIEQDESDVIYHYGATEVSLDDVDYDDQMESVREYLCGNCPF